MDVQKFTAGPFMENTYLLSSEGNALVIDPGFASESEYSSFKKKLKELELRAIVLTHAHVDHVLGLSRLLRDFEVPVYLSDVDYYLWKNFAKQSEMFGMKTADFDFIPEVLPADSTFECGPFKFRTLYTPGHSPDHISLYHQDGNFLIAGDVLFKEGIGRTDLYKGDFKLLKRSIKEKLYVLPDDTVVYPGHGEKTSIGYEKKNNPFVRS